MSCTVMYQPYAMSYSSSCDRTTADNLKKSFKFPHAPSPPESSHSNASSAYSSPGSTGGGSGLLGTLSLLPPHLHSPSASSLSSLSNNGASISGQRRPLTPSCASGGAPATITSATQQQQQSSHHQHSSSSSHSHSSHHHHHPHHSTSSSSSTAHHHQLHHHHHHHRSSSSTSATSLYPLSHSASLNLSSSSSAVAPTGTASSRDLSQHGPSSASSSSSGSTSSHHQTGQSSTVPSATVTSGGGDHSDDESPRGRVTSAEGGNGAGNGATEDESSTRAQYLSANCILYVNYDGNTARVVEDHFNRALSAQYTGEKSSKTLPMSTRNFPASFWNSNYQPSKTSAAAALAPYGAADFYGTAMDYSASISGFAHHAQADPWHHYPLSTHHHHHQSYHRPSDIAYPSMASTSRFNAAAQYGSFLFPSTSAARFSGIPTPGQCSVKGAADAAAHHWAAAATAGGRYDGWSDLHLAADYSAAAAAHYNMTAAAGKGLDFETHYLQSS